MSNNDSHQQHATESQSDLTQIVTNLIAFMETHMATQDMILRRDLRWRNIRAALIAIALVAGPLIYSIGIQRIIAPEKLDQDYAALVRIDGVIKSDTRSNAHKINRALELAYEDEKARAVIVLINSPGGTPVQAALIHERIKSLRAEYPDKKIVVIGEDMLTSGAYFIAVASDQICVNRSTMTGSIGVVMDSWGLDKLIHRYEIDRRVFTAGDRKARLDMFQPLKADDTKKVDSLLSGIHKHFIDAVMDGRQGKLTAESKTVFSGDYWTGDEAVSMGLVDGICSLSSVLKEFHVKRVKDFTLPPSIFQNLSNSFGVMAYQSIFGGLHEHFPMLTP